MADQPARRNVPRAQTWDLDDLFADRDAWQRECEALGAAIETVSAFHGRLGESNQTLLAALRADEALAIRFDRVAVFANLRVATDQTDSSH